MGRNFLNGRDGDRINAVLAAVGFNFRLLIRWLAAFFVLFLAAAVATQNNEKPA